MPGGRLCSGCPVNIDIPGFIEKIIEKDYRGAYDVVADANLLPAICGRVCPQEDQCEGVCPVGDTLEPVAIGRLERWLGDLAIAEGWSNIPYIEPNEFSRIGIVGSGPAGIACAADMAKAGCDVTVYEAFHKPGGVLQIRHSRIPPSRRGHRRRDRQPHQARRRDKVQHPGRAPVHRSSRCSTRWASTRSSSAPAPATPSFMGIPGESLNGVLSANELLTRCNLMRAGEFPDYDTPLASGPAELR